MSKCVSITPDQRSLHVASEAAAVMLVVPFLWWASGKTEDETARDGLRLLAVTTRAVYGYLLWKFTRKM